MCAFMPSRTCRSAGRPAGAPNAIAQGRDGSRPASVSLQGVEVQVGERDVPSLDPLGIGEPAALEFLGHRDGGALVGGVEVLPLVARGLQRLEQRRHAGDQLVDHAAIMADCGDDSDEARQATRPHNDVGEDQQALTEYLGRPARECAESCAASG